jgi:hypothetical protein
MAELDLNPYEDHLNAVWDMPLEAAEALRQKLQTQRRVIDGQLLVVDSVIARHKTNGTAPLLHGGGDPIFPASGPPSSGVLSRRMAFLQTMAKDPNRDWHLKEIRPFMVAAEVIEDNSVGTNRVSAAAAETKKNGEVEHVGPSLYRITSKGMAALQR